MKYRELYEEYRDLLACETKLRLEMYRIPKGYLVTKKIAGKEYLYLQYTAQGKKKVNISVKKTGHESRRRLHGGSLQKKKWMASAGIKSGWRVLPKFWTAIYTEPSCS